MAEVAADFAALPEKARTPFEGFARVLSELAGDNVLALSAFGGWLIDDPLYAGAAAQSVVVLRQFDLRLLARLAERGVQMGRSGLQAPLIMTPAYIAASCDVFPLELLEIQQLSVLLSGADHFAALQFDPDNVRLQAEREAKSELIHLHQGLLSSAGKLKHLDELCRRTAERAVRVLRGVLFLANATLPRRSTEIAARAAEVVGQKLAALDETLTGGRVRDLDRFERFYNDLAALAQYIDGLAVR